MATTEAELRIWNRLNVQEKAVVIVLFYIVTAILPWLSITVVFSFLAGRSCGIKVGELNASLERENKRALRAKILSELKKKDMCGGLFIDPPSSPIQPRPPPPSWCAKEYGEEQGEEQGE